MEQHKISQEDPADKHTFWKEHIEGSILQEQQFKSPATALLEK